MLREHTFRVTFKEEVDGTPLKDLNSELHRMFEELIRRGSEDYPGDAVARMYINAEGLNNAIIVRPRPLKEMTPSAVLEAIMAVLNSNQSILVTRKFTVQLGIAQFERGGRGRSIVNLETDIKSKKSVVSIRNQDYMCLARALAVSLAHLDFQEAKGGAKEREMRNRYNLVRKGDRNRKTSVQKKKAIEYHRLAGIQTDRPTSLSDIPKFEDALDIDIYIFAAHLNQKLLYPDRERPRRRRRCYLFFTKHQENQGHFDAITNVPAFLGKSYFCHTCLKAFNDRQRHFCEEFCRTCRSKTCPEGNKKTCKECHMECRSDECFKNHQLRKYIKGKEIEAPCKKYYKCLECKTVLDLSQRKKEDHICWEFKCNYCSNYYTGNHLCYLRIREAKKSSCKYIFFDFECTQETGIHEANYLVAQTVCSSCIEEPCEADSTCQSCGTRCRKCNHRDKKSGEYSHQPCDGCAKREVIFSGPETQKQFGKWLFSMERSNYTAISHNGKSYDNYFLLAYLIQNGSVPKIIYNGSKIMMMHLEKGYNIRIIDSSNFLPMRLSALPKAFGLTERSKGFFPHLFNKSENWNHRGSYPPVEDYGIESMFTAEREEFLKWYNSRQGSFDFQEQMLVYCRNDVQLLREACLKFRQMLLSLTGESNEFLDPETLEVKKSIEGGIDPLTYLTIASVCMNIFRSKFLTETHSAVTEEEANKAESEKRKPERTLVTKKGKDFFQEGRMVKVTESSFLNSPLAMIPSGGYANRDQFSKVSIQWLEWEAKKRGVRIRHALNEGEVKFPAASGRNYRLDGYYMDPNTLENVCLEYNSCVHHGCLCQDGILWIPTISRPWLKDMP